MLSLDKLEAKLKRIDQLHTKVVETLSPEQKSIFDEQLSKARTTHFALEDLNAQVRNHQDVIHGINKKFNSDILRVLIIGVIAIAIGYIFGDSTSNSTTFLYLFAAALVFGYAVYKKDSEINEQQGRINALRTTMEIFKRDLSLVGIDGEDKILETRNLISLLYVDDDLPEANKQRQKILNKTLSIQFIRMELLLLQHLFPKLEAIESNKEFDSYLWDSYYTLDY